MELVDKEIIALLKRLESRHIPTLALTAWWTGQWGTIAKMEDLRFQGLNQVGISFVNMSPFKTAMTFPHLDIGGGVPMVKDGIILTALADKGGVLKAALAQAQLQFHKIIFIDDDLTYLQAVERMCRELKIEFIGIHYIQASLMPLPKLDQATEKKRFVVLEQEHLWLTDEELAKHLHP